jgi:hypothetical protein
MMAYPTIPYAKCPHCDGDLDISQGYNVSKPVDYEQLQEQFRKLPVPPLSPLGKSSTEKILEEIAPIIPLMVKKLSKKYGLDIEGETAEAEEPTE